MKENAGNNGDNILLQILGGYTIILLAISLFALFKLDGLSTDDLMPIIAIYMSFTSAVMAYNSAKLKVNPLIMSSLSVVSKTDKKYQIQLFNERDRSEYLNQVYICLERYAEVQNVHIKLHEKEANKITIPPFGVYTFEFTLKKNLDDLNKVKVVLAATSGKHVCKTKKDYWEPLPHERSVTLS
ncbi:hypothetical protein [Vibrio bathopelagicus]